MGNSQSDQSFNNINQNVFGLTALIVSLVALLTTVLQVLQQYFSSAEGYRRCAESVMGLWAKGTHRKLVSREFRVEVVFETPVIFVAPPSNTKGPIPDRKIHYIDGTDASYKNTKVLKPQAQKKHDETAISRVHTADDERASWVTLLSMLQRAEYDSRDWDKTVRTATPPRTPIKIAEDPEYEIAVGLQGKIRSWDFIPASITKPYATSAICHLVEITAMLGLYWKVFDQTVWNLRAEGNGLILTSTTVHGLGVMVVFAVTGKSKFTENRVIPCEAVKELAFGTVPNIFDEQEYLTQGDAQSLELEFGKPHQAKNTLESLGCSAETLKHYDQDHRHIFSISFEIIGMLGKVFRIRGSNFRMLPNPTSDHWLKAGSRKASWRITRLMEVFQKKVKEQIKEEGYVVDHDIHIIDEQWDEISRIGYTDETILSLEIREAIHNALDSRTKYLLNQKQSDVLFVLVAHLANVLKVLSDPSSPLNTIVLANKEEALLNYYFYHIRPTVIGNLDSDDRPLSKTEKDKRNTIWISLIFRRIWDTSLYKIMATLAESFAQRMTKLRAFWETGMKIFGSFV
ncbi:hypothetical protein G7Y89_g4534 [Cudoniella acicularis]|uniref:Modin n=1 Tax=Cudoniella acicularis TaxID=354080 RepID=A0A8H4RRE3_9HELO|nr:hypothetical protein G7Y89_g4534 [Cudoniella acicularis]